MDGEFNKFVFQILKKKKYVWRYDGPYGQIERS